MSLINYIEPVSGGEIFMGIAELIITCVIAYICYRLYFKFVQYIDVLINREIKYELIEEVQLDKIGKKHGIDLNEELMKRAIIHSKRPKSMRRKLEEQVYKEIFKEKEDE